MQYTEFLLEYYRRIVERNFPHPNNPKIYAGGSMSSW
jgi:hypothetical protein